MYFILYEMYIKPTLVESDFIETNYDFNLTESHTIGVVYTIVWIIQGVAEEMDVPKCILIEIYLG